MNPDRNPRVLPFFAEEADAALTIRVVLQISAHLVDWQPQAGVGAQCDCACDCGCQAADAADRPCSYSPRPSSSSSS